MVERRIQIVENAGLHGRPVTDIVHEAGKYNSHLSIQHQDRTVDLHSVLGVLSLGVQKGGEVLIRAEGQDEAIAMENLLKLIVENGIGNF